ILKKKYGPIRILNVNQYSESINTPEEGEESDPQPEMALEK
ncbi:6424_t:CDS:2, partial [Racocetra fulgida]